MIIEYGGLSVVDAVEIDPARVGRKAAGISRLPAAWVPPYFVVRSDQSPTSAQIVEAARLAGISAGTSIYVRSSGTAEGMDERGSLESAAGDLADAAHLLEQLKLRTRAAQGVLIHWIIQAGIKSRAKGHLSNERRVSKVARDWVAEMEPLGGTPSVSARVAVRRWRDAGVLEVPVYCDMRAKIPRTLRVVAQWCGSARSHLEWVWDGERIWIVQLDAVKPLQGVDPRKLVSSTQRITLRTSDLRVFRIATKEDLDGYRKLANARLYVDLGYELPEFYVLDKVEVLASIRNGEAIDDALRSDLELLCAGPFVLRTDGLNIPPNQRQMLPRSDELRSVEDAIDWLTNGFAKKLGSIDVRQCKVALIGHNFIPAAAAAWCLAYPDRRRVRIESLWGLPEGLYYYPHDVFDVDTGHVDVRDIRVSDTRIVGRSVRHKSKFVAPDSDGNWIVHSVAEGADWAQSIARDEWVYEIACTSRRIANAEGRATVIMWLIEMPQGHSKHAVLPWYHEEWTNEQSASFRTAPRRRGLTHSVRTLRTAKDLEDLLRDTASGVSVSYVAVEPEEGAIVREKDFIERLARDAKEHGYEVQLRGGVLSHVFYALAREGAAVSCVDLFEQEEQTIEYNKLVRDDIPATIAERGENVEVVELKGEALLLSLKRKLLEESLEVSDAFDSDSISDEIADVLEVVDSIVEALDVDRDDVARRKRTKRAKRGGFSKGLMLLRTHLPTPSDAIEGDPSRRVIDRSEKLPSQPPLLHFDRRTTALGAVERQVTLDTPIASANGFAKGHLDMPTLEGKAHPMRLEATVLRQGSDIRLRLKIANEAVQLPLFRDGENAGESEAETG